MKYYAVRVGIIPGIYTDWELCKQQINGYKGASYKSFSSLSDAETFMRVKYEVIILSNDIPLTSTVPSSKMAIIPFISLCNSIFVDGAHNKVTKDEAWGSITDYRGNDLVDDYRELLSDMDLRDVLLPVGNRTIIISKFKSPNVSGQRISLLHGVKHISSKDKSDLGSLLTQQNNGAELLALVGGLRIVLSNPNSTIRTIYSDSSCVLSWSLGLGSSQRMTFDPRKVRYIDELIGLRREFESLGGIIVKISGDNNRADLGYHRS